MTVTVQAASRTAIMRVDALLAAPPMLTTLTVIGHVAPLAVLRAWAVRNSVHFVGSKYAFG